MDTLLEAGAMGGPCRVPSAACAEEKPGARASAKSTEERKEEEARKGAWVSKIGALEETCGGVAREKRFISGGAAQNVTVH